MTEIGERRRAESNLQKNSARTTAILRSPDAQIRWAWATAVDPKPPYAVITYIYTGEYSIAGITAALEKDGVADRTKG